MDEAKRSMVQNVIAIICDCDGTLCPDTTDKLVSELGLDLKDFWKPVSKLVEAGWDPPLAYLNRLLELTRSGVIEAITRTKLKAVADAVQFYPGALDFVERLRGKLDMNSEFREARIVINWYIVSSGIEEILQATPISYIATEIYGCAFAYDHQARASAVKRAVTFTEKTKFIYAINKGIPGEELRRKPYRVNDVVPSEERMVPFEHMIYIGDGPSDIPCFSMIRHNEGHTIGVMPPEDMDLRKPYELAQGKRLTVGPYTADYREGSDLSKMLGRIVDSIATLILEKRAQRVRPAPEH